MKALGNKESSFAQSPPSQAQAVADARSVTELTETELAMAAAAGSKPGGIGDGRGGGQQGRE